MTGAVVLGTLVLGVLAGSIRAADEPTLVQRGAEIYKTQCAACHGDNGEGVSGVYDSPLAGDLSVGRLGAVIADTMPEGEPDLCIGPDAEAVAAYIHEAFYSPAAQARNQTPRIDLVRLTAVQYRQSVTDLIGSFRWNPWVPPVRGLKTKYYKDRRPRKEDLILERLEGSVAFDMATITDEFKGQLETPSFDQRKGGIVPKAKSFCITWEGALLPERTGVYEIHLVTSLGADVKLNTWRSPFIDARVRSGPESEYTETIALEAGRPMFINIQAFRENEDAGRVRLEWTPPGGKRELIPTRCLEPEGAPELFVLKTNLPPDDASDGFVRGTMVSEAWDQATTDAAFEVLDYVLAQLDDLAKTKADAKDRPKKLREFCEMFVRRAFRRPLSDEQKHHFVGRFFEGMPEGGEERDSFLVGAVSRVVLLTLKSPRFLYPGLHDGPQDGYDAVARLALTLWDSIPDDGLVQGVEKGWLTNENAYRDQANRMIGDHRCRAKVQRIMNTWLRVDHLHDLAKDSTAFPDFTDEIMADLRISLDLMIEDILWKGSGDFRLLMTSTDIPMTERMAKFYGVPDEVFQKAREEHRAAQHKELEKFVEETWIKQKKTTDQWKLDPVEWTDEFVRISFEPHVRGGVVSHPFLLAGFAYNQTSSPIHRGVFLARNVLGRTLRPPQEAFTPFSPKDHPNLTTRERTLLQTDSAACQVCHNMINGLGFTLEAFDTVGRFREKEGERVVDATGTYHSPTDEVTAFSGPRELVTYLAESEETQRAFGVTLLHGLVGQPAFAFGPETPATIRKQLAEKNYDVRKLLAEIATLAAKQGIRSTD